ncbi:MAG: hypothetical protein A3K19_21920 [Lentisphaerae bacterium RIFOXYB12_FULL_65_16]|nr:MAG: hypothetical protein A3K18_04330 [Lentisphaerae bacterium RIFOXYA12_64_32]OGV93915.1 MAG: hypothetical protein A3K19_21920 [Lentisphaerae bacterium RIFOXYB12_FULL_65_16]
MAQVPAVVLEGQLQLAPEEQKDIALPAAERTAGAVRFWFRPDGVSAGTLLDLSGLTVAYYESKNVDYFHLKWPGADGKQAQAKWGLPTPHYPERWHRIDVQWDKDRTARLAIDGGYASVNEKALPEGFRVTALRFGPKVKGAVERVMLFEGAPDNAPFVGVHAAYDFEGPEAAAGWSGYQGAPIALNAGDGAMGSKGFLRVGPHPDKWVGVNTSLPFLAGENTWVGFSARIPQGGSIKFMLADDKQKKNVSKAFELPKDGAWATCWLQVRWLGVSPDTLIPRLSFFVDNPSRAPVYYDVDNIVIGSGAKIEPPQSVPGVTASFNGDLATVAWSAPFALGGVREYRVYRGLHAEFACDQRHLIEVTTNAAATDTAFAHNGEYFYAVRAVDFAGNEGPDSGAVRVEVK